MKLQKLTLKHLFKLANALDNPEVAENVCYKFKTPLLQSLEELIKRKNTHKFAIIIDGKLVGLIALENPNKEKTIYEAGFFVARPYWGKGIATDALKQIIKIGKDLGIKKIIGDNDLTNPGSGKVFKKSGFRKVKVDKKKGIEYWERKL